MNIKWILGVGSIGALAFLAQPVDAHHCGAAGGREMQTAMARRPAAHEHADGAACQGHAKDDPQATATADVNAGDAAKAATENALKPQTTCPIMKGGAINPDLYVDHEGQRIYVCCPGCIDRVKADPEAALEKLREQGVVPANAVEEPAAAEEPQEHQHHH